VGTIRGKIKSQGKGPITNCEISVSTTLAALLLNTGGQVPNSIICKALIDTGATTTVIKEGVATKLNIQQTGSYPMIGASDKKAKYWPMYAINLKVESGDSFDITVVEMPIRFGYGVKCLMGRDILNQGVFAYIGNQGKFELKF